MELKKIELMKREDDLIEKAIILVNELFKDITDKQGHPYIEHLYYVSNHLETYEEKVVGLLHDVIEDTYINEKVLLELKFPKNIVEAVSLLTRNKEISYDDYIDSIIQSNNLLAIKVKKVDMMHNMNKERLAALDENVRKKLEKKYIKNYQKINNILEKRG